jgi:cytochrome c oxidase subunit 2
MKLAIAIVFLVILSLVFHFVSPWWFTPIASNWGAIDTTIEITFWVTGIVFVLVNLFIAYAIYRFKHKKGQKAHYEPENHRLEIILTVITTIGVVAMLAPGLVVWSKFVDPPEDALVFEALGKQWDWAFRFPGDDGELGVVDTFLVSAENPFGIDPNDGAGHDDVLITANEVHLPKDQPVKVLLRSLDVLHNFSVPQFRVKMDLVPGMITYMWLTPTRTGTFDLLCEELCGLAHHTMRGQVVVDEQADFDSWLDAQPTFAETQQVAAGNAATGQALYAVCGSCHGAQGEGNAALNAPQLAGLGAWYIRRQLSYYKQGIRGAAAGDTFGQQMAPMAAVLANDAAISDVAAYIATFPDTDGADTITGDASRGQSFYVTCCGTCHGRQGEGNYALNAPRLAGQEDWYLKRQIENFRQGVRGAHPDDEFGVQMTLMANMLNDDASIDDVIAYINTLTPGDDS